MRIRARFGGVALLGAVWLGLAAPGHAQIPIRTIALTPVSAPGADDPLTLLAAATVSPRGDVVFYGRSASGRDEGYWMSRFGEPGLFPVAIDGQDVGGDVIATPVPGLTENMPAMINADGVVALKVTLRAGGASILRYRDGALEIAASSADLPSGTTVGDAAWLNAEGRIAFSDGNSVYVETATGLVRVVGRGDTFGLITVNSVELAGWFDDGTASIVVYPEIDPTPTIGPLTILYWSGSSVSVALDEADEVLASDASGQLAVGFDPLPGLADGGDLSRQYLVGTPNGPSAFHTEMNGGIYNFVGQVTRTGLLVGQMNNDTDYGVARLSPGFDWIANATDPLPGGSGAFGLDTLATAAPSDLTAVLTERFSGSGGIWLQSLSTDALEGPVVMAGTPLEVADGDLRMVTRVPAVVDSNLAGRPRPLNDLGHLAFIAELADGNSGVFVTHQDDLASADVRVASVGPMLAFPTADGFSVLFDVTNDGPSPIIDLDVTVASDPPLTLVSVEDGCATEGAGVGCHYVGPSGGLDTLLAPGESRSFTLTLGGGVASSYDVTIGATSSMVDPQPDNNTLAVTVTNDGLPRIEGEIVASQLNADRWRFVATVRNVGDEDVRDVGFRVTFSELMSALIVLDGSTSPDCSGSPPSLMDMSTYDVVCSRTSLAVGEEVMIPFEVRSEQNFIAPYSAFIQAVGVDSGQATPAIVQEGTIDFGRLGSSECAASPGAVGQRGWPYLALLGLIAWARRRRGGGR